MARVQMKSDLVDGYVALAPVIPVVTIEDVATAVPLARILVEAGLPVVEVTLRTGRALAAIEAIAREVPEAIVAAGTVIRPDQIAAVEDAGARLIVTPGTSPEMILCVAESALPAIPAAATVSEALSLLERGFAVQKLFPAAAIGGLAWLKAVGAPVPGVRFCPTGGIDLAGAPAYLALPNVACVGGSWMVPRDAVAAGDWARIGRLAREAAALPRP